MEAIQQDIDINQIEKVCKKTNLENFFLEYSKTDKTLGHMANRISGGQMQRLALARALYRNPQLLVLDEFFYI